MQIVTCLASLFVVAALGCSSADFETSSSADDDTGAELDTGSPANDSAATHDTRHEDGIAESSPADAGVDTSSADTTIDTSTPIDTATIDTPTSSSASFLFPKSSDTRHLIEDPYMGLAGDFLDGTRTTTLTSARRFSGSFDFENALTGGSLSLDVIINGIKVGSIGPISAPGDGAPATSSPVSFDFSFAPIAGPTFDVRYNAAPSSDRLGTIGVHFDASTVRLES